MPKTILFYRDFQGPSGGHLKIRDYYDHIRSSPACEARIFVTPGSRADHLWAGDPGLVADFDPESADLLVLGGKDWQAMPAGIEDKVPVLNVVQGVRHASPDDPRHRFLARKASRVCVGREIAEALKAGGTVNGPVHTIPAGLDLSLIPRAETKSVDVFIAGLKARDLARAVAASLQASGISVDCLTDQVPRPGFLRRMAAARVAITLPVAVEGFFLPALEAMAAGCAVVCPDAIGNRSFCIDGETCLVPPAEAGALAAAARRLLQDPKLCERLRRGGLAMASRHSIEGERKALLSVVRGISPRNIILTGLPRSGTTLTCNLLNSLRNTVALHEPMSFGRISGCSTEVFIDAVVKFFDAQRRMILEEGKATSKATDGKVPRNPMSDQIVDGKRVKVIDGREITVENVDNCNFDLCMKHPGMFTARLPELIEVFDCYASIRNPLSVLLSWRDSTMAVGTGHMPVAEANSPALADRLARTPDVLDRQLILLDLFFSRYRKYLPDRTIRYEDVVATGGAALGKIVPAAARLREELSSRNSRKLANDPEVNRVAAKLLNHENACWQFYDRKDVESLLADETG